jgi:hypothetical protein
MYGELVWTWRIADTRPALPRCGGPGRDDGRMHRWNRVFRASLVSLTPLTPATPRVDRRRR